MRTVLIFWATTFILVCSSPNIPDFSDEWVVRTGGGRAEAVRIAIELGYNFVREVRGFQSTYVFQRKNYNFRGKRDAIRLSKRLSNDKRVVWAEQQVPLRREKRSSLLIRELQDLQEEIIQTMPVFNDEYWFQQWYMNGATIADVKPVYRAGYTGFGIRIAIVDDGLERAHEDLRDNFDEEISYNMIDDVPDPTPLDPTKVHGTRCAGVVAMAANNYKCGVGVAFNAKVGGILMLIENTTDRLEGESLRYAYDKVDIYSSSWGPSDYGDSVRGPGKLTQEAFYLGSKEGRDGKGNIFIWAAGNGGAHGDSCGCDGYVNNIYTIAIGSVTADRAFPSFGEKCAATMATMFSSDSGYSSSVVAADLGNKCTTHHSGTSASAPLAAGIVALVLESRNDLTWRDIQHLIVRTATPGPLDDFWFKTAAGYYVRSGMGFGIMNPVGMVELAKSWVNVTPQGQCSTTFKIGSVLKPTEPFVVQLELFCEEVHYLEHLELKVNIQNQRRGKLKINLKSPAGTLVKILEPRERDESSEGFIDWTFMSVLNWNENPNGNWTVEVIDTCDNCHSDGFIKDLSITAFGTETAPFYLK